MTLQFQSNLLKYLVQKKEALPYYEFLDRTFFKSEQYKLLFDAAKEYVELYGLPPAKSHLMQFIDLAIEREGDVDSKIRDLVKIELKKLYHEIPADEKILLEHIVTFARRSMLQEIFIKHADSITTADEEKVKEIYSDISKVTTLGIERPDVVTIGDDSDILDFEKEKQNVHPMFLQTINNMTEDGGFFSPQFIIFLGGPKTFKTGILINIAVNYMKAGLNILYVDFENGYKQITQRIYQCLLNCQKSDLSKYSDELKGILHTANKLGAGSIKVLGLRGRHDSLTQVESFIASTEVENRWKPDLIIYDYLDIAGCADHRITDRRLQIQHTYYHAMRINKDQDCFSMTVSKVKQAAFTKDSISIGDFAEDSEKAYNAHAAFAINRTEDEIENHIARITPIVQRAGISRAPGFFCAIKIDEANQQIEEVSINDMEYS